MLSQFAKLGAFGLAVVVLGASCLHLVWGDEPQAGQGEVQVKHFSAREIREVRRKVAAIGELPQETPNGWSKSRVDPMKILSAFPELKVREGYVLRAYIFKEDGNSNGFVWALPQDAAYPEAEDCPRLESHFLNPPKPLDALDDVMEVIEGDDSPASYLHASLLRREVREFGGGWHGIKWGMQTILDQSPWKGAADENAEPFERPRSKLRDWKWLSEQPKNWAPEVRMEKEKVVVTFYTYTALIGTGSNNEMEKERIYRYTDTYRRGKYRSLAQEKKLATGPDAIAQ